MHRLALFLIVALSSSFVFAQTRDDPVALIADIYKTYQTDTKSPGYSDIYSRRLQALIDADTKATPEGEVGKIDWDVFVNGNDWQLSELTITLVSKSDLRAQVLARFFNFKDPHEILFDLVREDARWTIDDVRETRKGNRWTMSKILTGAPDAFPDEK
jgi:hypothetical protein